jgi:hypothetical protein
MTLAYADTTRHLDESPDTARLSYPAWLRTNPFAQSESFAGMEGDMVLVDVVRLPLHVRIERAPAGYFTVVEAHTGIFGQGDSYIAAIDDFQVALREHCDVLSAQDRLSAELADQLEYLERYLHG